MNQKKIKNFIIKITLFLIIELFWTTNITAYSLPLETKKQMLYGLNSAGIYFQNKPIIRFFVTEKEKDPSQRATKTFESIQQMIALGLTEKDITLISTKNQILAIIQNDPSKQLFYVTTKESEINKTPLDQLAKEWLNRIKIIFDWIPNYRNTDYTLWEPKEYLPCRGYAKAYVPSQTKMYPYFIAAHPFFPLGTKIRVTNIIKKWSIVVTIEERISTSDSMILVEKTAAEAIGLSQTPQFVLLEEMH